MTDHDKDLKPYDLESVYDEQISPLMTKIIEICKQHNMPMVASFQYQVDEESGPGWCTTILATRPGTGNAEFPAAQKLWKAAEILSPSPPTVVLAVTERTNEAGNKTISIKRIQ